MVSFHFHSRRRVAGLLAACLLSLFLAHSARSEEGSLTARLDSALLRLGPHTTAAARVLALPGGEVLYERNADLSLIPASNMKLVTSAAALALLGPEYRYATRVLCDGKRRGGSRLRGDLVLQGGGDPVLELRDLEELARAVRAAGIRKVEGDLVVDDYRYDAERLGFAWNWDDEPYYYSAQVSALSVDRGVLRVDVHPGAREGDPVRITQRPLPGYLRVGEAAKTSAPETPTNLEVTRARGKNEIVVTGALGVGAKPVLDQRLTMEEPELYAGALFRKLLADSGVRVRGKVRRARSPAGLAVVAAHPSPPLSEIAAKLNKPSDNLIAELLLKEIGATRQLPGTSDGGAKVVREWMQARGIDVDGIIQRDGSGLSRCDMVTARFLCDLLRTAATESWYPVFLASLPVAGVDGSLAGRMKGTAAEKNVQAKTGSMQLVRSLSGYATTRDGRRLVFSVLINGYTGPTTGPNSIGQLLDTVAVSLAEHQAATQ